MQQFTVPQFIDVEDKIIGPITVRQFIIILVAGLFLFLEYKFSDMVLFLLLAIPTALVFATIAFVKINSMPFHYFLLNFIQTFKKPKIRVWARIYEPLVKEKGALAATTVVPRKAKPLSGSRLAELSLVVDTGGVYQSTSLQDNNPTFLSADLSPAASAKGEAQEDEN